MAKIRVVAQRRKKSWPTKKGRAHAKKSRWAYKRKDTGKPGLTPKSERFFKVSGLAGKLGTKYTDMPATKRRQKLIELDAKKNISSRSLWSHLQGLANVTTDKQAKDVFSKDADWAMGHLMNRQERMAMTSAARKK